LAAAANILCVPWVPVHRSDWEALLLLQKQIEKEFRYPLFVKPASLGSVCRDEQSALA